MQKPKDDREVTNSYIGSSPNHSDFFTYNPVYQYCSTVEDFGVRNIERIINKECEYCHRTAPLNHYECEGCGSVEFKLYK